MKVKYIFVIFFIVLFFSSCRSYLMPGGSMEDTLKVGDHLFAQIIFYGEPKRGDLVVFRPPHEKNKDYIKRCVAVAGDNFSIKDGAVYLNEKKLDEPYVKGLTKMFFGKKSIDGVVPKGKIVVLGDNRENSMDSRFFGYVDASVVKGKAVFIYFNSKDMSRVGFIK